MPEGVRRMPSSGSSVISTSASRLLVVGSQPGNSMPAALRTRLRPPSHPTRYSARSDCAVGQLDVDAGVVLREARHLTSAIDRHRQLADPAGQDALDVVLPQPEPVGVPGGKVADVQRDPGEPRDLRHLPLRQEPIGDPALIEHLDGACVQTARARAGEAPGWRAARRWRRRPPPTPTRPPASAPSDRLRRSPPHVRSSATPSPSVRREILQHDPVLRAARCGSTRVARCSARCSP